MNTLEHLQRIKAKCQELLANAEKRTAGRWDAEGNVCWSELLDGYYFVTCDAKATSLVQDEANAVFIASCAGAAEAGWKATIAAIEILPALDRIESSRLADEIIAAWPQELL